MASAWWRWEPAEHRNKTNGWTKRHVGGLNRPKPAGNARRLGLAKGFFVSDNLLPSFVNPFWYSLSAVIMPFQSSHIVSGSNRKPKSIAPCELQAVETWRKFYGKSARRGGLWWMTNTPPLTESVTDRRCSAVGSMRQRSRNVNRNEATSSLSSSSLIFLLNHISEVKGEHLINFSDPPSSLMIDTLDKGRES